MDSYFHNPYNFIPAPRPEFPPGVGLGQGRPASHDRYHSERWSGRIRVRLTAKAPLMLPDSSAVENVSGDKSRPHYAARMARDPRFLEPRPYLAPTGLKGALRSDYEAITNSRLSVFSSKGPIFRRTRAGREASEARVEALLPFSLRPANSIETLSAADRVFGWTADEAEQNDAPIAHRGQLRIADVVCVQGGFLDFGKAGLALKSLGAPQRQQARFYAALDQSGRPVEDGKPLADVFYNKGQGIRGRKVFLTQRDRPTDLDGWRRALRNCVDGQEARSKTNRTVKDLVEEGAVFEAEIEVTNLNDEELGALLWLLDLAHQEPQMDGEPLLKLGGGKPLGLGCVSVELRALALSRGTAIAERYRAIAAPEQAAEVLFEMKRGSPRKDASDLPVCASDCIESFKKQVGDCHGSGAFLDAPFVKAFLQAARGVHGDVVYPEILGDPDANGYAWFVENEKGPRLALPGLADGVPNGLPRLPAQD